nr:hypothetical protein [Halorubellus sp. JP-L1]
MEYADLREAVKSYAVEHGEPPTTEEAANDGRFPSLATIYKRLDGSWNDLLEDAGLKRGHVGEYGPAEATDMLQDMRAVLHTVESSYLTTRQYAENGSYADDTIKETFGSWREACERAKIDAGEKYGVRCEGPRGSTLESRQELKIAELLHERDIEYEVHPDLDGTSWVGDFYLSAFELWVEVNGFADGERPNAADFEQKLKHYEEQGLDCVVLESPEELVAEIRA